MKVDLTNPDGTFRTLAEIEADALVFALSHHKDMSIAAIARALGIGRTTFYRKLKNVPPDVLSEVKPSKARKMLEEVEA